MAIGPGNQVMGYILGKAEGEGRLWHGHVTAVTVAPDFRRQHLAQKLMKLLEDVTEKVLTECIAMLCQELIHVYLCPLGIESIRSTEMTFWTPLSYCMYGCLCF
jgi:GNAT superfamily N-acetyltransferase